MAERVMDLIMAWDWLLGHCCEWMPDPDPIASFLWFLMEIIPS